jgi:tRNA uridine 5-carboxymethylaminomethyl modification enzyme
MKTGTPPRVDGRSLDYKLMEEQKGDEHCGRFSFTNTALPKNQRSCHITYTNTNVHDILRLGFDDSPMFNGRIKGVGPRYCPSIEDKIERFSERDRHQIFVEPEGWNTVEVYVNGFSSSLAETVQYEALKKIDGFKNVKMFRPGYAIEYDFFQPTQLKQTLETKAVTGLYFAGQINGTTGYEEAACQGFWAGVNAHNSINQKNPFILNRSEAYMGVLIDDLINKGTEEPYRMFTSRAEFRLLLRQDNADQRLTHIGYREGLISDKRMENCKVRGGKINEIISYFKKTSIEPLKANPILEKKDTSLLRQKVKLISLISRPQIGILDLAPLLKDNKSLFSSINENNSAEIQMKYSGYIEKEHELAKRLTKLDKVLIPKKINYNKIGSISAESREKLNHIKPNTLGQASRISGVSPSDISVLLIKINQ